MDQEYLLDTAKRLTQVNEEVFNEYIEKSELLVARINSDMLKRPDLLKLIGQNNIEMMKDNHSNHVRFIGSILKSFNPNVLVETILWVFRAYRNHGFSSNYWPAQLNTWIKILEVELSPNSFKQVYTYYRWMAENIPSFDKLSGKEIGEV